MTPIMTLRHLTFRTTAKLRVINAAAVGETIHQTFVDLLYAYLTYLVTYLWKKAKIIISTYFVPLPPLGRVRLSI